MTLIRNLPALVTVSSDDLLPVEDVSELTTKKMTVGQLATFIIAQIGGGGGGIIDLDSQGPIPITLGGFTAGEAGIYTVDEYGNKLLRPYFAPSISSMTNATLIKTFEVGESLPNGTKSIDYTIVNPGKIKSQPPNVGVPSTDIVGATFPVNPVLLSASSSFNIVIPSGFHLDEVDERTITLTGTNSKDATFSKTVTIFWKWKRFVGNSSLTSMASADIIALNDAGTIATDTIAGTYVFEAGGYKWIWHESTLGTLTSFKDAATQLSVPFQSPVIVSVTNAFGITTNYRGYRTTNSLGGAITVIAA
jgi:hypothetical protein